MSRNAPFALLTCRLHPLDFLGPMSETSMVVAESIWTIRPPRLNGAPVTLSPTEREPSKFVTVRMLIFLPHSFWKLAPPGVNRAGLISFVPMWSGGNLVAASPLSRWRRRFYVRNHLLAFGLGCPVSKINRRWLAGNENAPDAYRGCGPDVRRDRPCRRGHAAHNDNR